IEKLKIFPDELAARQRVAARYAEALRNVVVTPTLPAGTTSAWAQYTVIVPGGARDRLAEELKRAGVPTAVYYPPPLPPPPPCPPGRRPAPRQPPAPWITRNACAARC